MELVQSRKIYLVLLVLLVFVSLVSSVALQQEPRMGLYSKNDNVEILTADNFKKSIYNSDRVWLVEFYNTWCGYCQRFAPSWKEFATDVKNWSDLIVVAAIDCADEINYALCGEFKIYKYPYVKYFPEKYQQDPQNLGIEVFPDYSAYDHRKSLLNILKQDQTKRHSTIYPDLQPFLGNVSEIFNSATLAQNFAVLIVQDATDTIGPEIILDFHKVPSLLVKYTYNNNTGLTDNLGLRQATAMYTLERSNAGSPKVVTTYSADRNGFRSTVNRLLQSKNIPLPQDQEDKPTTILTQEFSTERPNAPKPESIRVDNIVFQVDLENALRYSLKREVGTVKQISGEQLEALRNYLGVLQKYFPFGVNGKLLLKQIKDYADTSYIVDGTEISKMVRDAEAPERQVFSSPQQWIGCKGSAAWFRGYPCGLWKMFHYITVNAAIEEMDKLNTDPQTVLRAMHGYVKNFFGCMECTTHFTEMATRRRIFNVNSWDESILWLWRAHNEVNKRLSGDQSEDPDHPKIQFPSKGKCSSCYKPDETFNEEAVLAYLKGMYNKQNVQYDGSNTRVINLPMSQAGRIHPSAFMPMIFGIIIITSQALI